jgi:hypothetical protein
MADSNIGTLWVKIGAKMDGLEKSLSDVEKATTKIGKHLQSVGKQMTVAGVAITASLGLMVKKTADFGDELNDLRQKTGIAADTLSSFKLAADKSGTSLSGIAVGLRFLGRSMVDAASGGKESAEAFRSMGISVADASGKLRPMDDVMLDVAEKFAGMEDGARKTDLAIQLFGKSGTALIPMLNLGKAGIAELREEAKRLGIVVSNDAAKAADEFNDAMVSLKASVQGAGMAIATSIMPTIKGLATVVTGIISRFTEWATKNGALTQTLTAMAGGTGALLTVFGAFSLALGTIMTKLPLVAAALKMTTASLLYATTAWAAGVTAIGYYIAKLSELSDAKAELRAAEKNDLDYAERVNTKLHEAATLTFELGQATSEFTTNARMEEIIASYGEFSAAATVAARKAILLGEYGPVLAAALKQVEEKARASARGTNELDNSLIALGINVPAIQKELALAQQTLDDYRNSANPLPGVIAALEKKIADLQAQLNGASTATAHLSDRFVTLGDDARAASAMLEVLMAAADQTDKAFTTLGNAVGGGLGEAIDYIEPKADGLFDGLGTSVNKAAGEVKTATSQMSHYFDGLYNDIAQGLGSAFENLFSGMSAADKKRKADLKQSLADLTASFKKGEISLEEYQKKYAETYDEMRSITGGFQKFFTDIWGTIKKAFFRIIGEMVAEFLVNFVKNIVAGMNLVNAATSSWGSIFSGAGAAVGGVGTAGAGAAMGGTAATGAAVSAGAAIGTAFTAAFLGVWAYGFAQAIVGVFSWGKKKSKEQYEAERAWIATLTPRQQSQVNWWMADSAPGNRGGVQMYFQGPIIQTTGMTQADCYRASEYIFNAVESASRRRGGR